MFSERLLDHFENPRNVGELPPPAILAQASNPICGDILKLTARVEDGRVVEARYQTRGCTASIAVGSALTELLVGRELAELATLRADTVEAAAGGLPNESKHAAVLAVDAVQALLEAAKRAAAQS